MRTDLYWIATPTPGRLAVMPRPRGGDWLEDEARAWKDAGVDVVVSLLTPDEIAEFDLAHEAEFVQVNGMLFWSKPVVDRGVPQSTEEAAEFVSMLAKLLESGQNVAIHCRQGIGRSALFAVAALVASGVEVNDAIGRVSRARGRAVPETPDQHQWLLDFARTTVPQLHK